MRLRQAVRIDADCLGFTARERSLTSENRELGIACTMRQFMTSGSMRSTSQQRISTVPFSRTSCCALNQSAARAERRRPLQPKLSCDMSRLGRINRIAASVSNSGTSTETMVPISDLTDLVRRCLEAEGHTDDEADIVTEVRPARCHILTLTSIFTEHSHDSEES